MPCMELNPRLPEPPLTLPPAVTGPVQGELQLHIGELALQEAAGAAAGFQELQVGDVHRESAMHAPCMQCRTPLQSMPRGVGLSTKVP